VREQRKTLEGLVVSDKMDKTVVVRVERKVRHPRYGKVLRRAKKFKAHDQDGLCHVGDLVRIAESRPLSREKRWTVTDVLTRGPGAKESEAAQ
jgi:small subunit ribosomal protein S17